MLPLSHTSRRARSELSIWLAGSSRPGSCLTHEPAKQPSKAHTRAGCRNEWRKSLAVRQPQEVATVVEAALGEFQQGRRRSVQQPGEMLDVPGRRRLHLRLQPLEEPQLRELWPGLGLLQSHGPKRWQRGGSREGAGTAHTGTMGQRHSQVSSCCGFSWV